MTIVNSEILSMHFAICEEVENAFYLVTEKETVYHMNFLGRCRTLQWAALVTRGGEIFQNWDGCCLKKKVIDAEQEEISEMHFTRQQDPS